MFTLIGWIACARIDDAPKTFEERYDNGQISISGQIQNEIPQGTWKEWFDNGQLKAEYHFLDGTEHGIRKAWYKDGQQAEQGVFKCGSRMAPLACGMRMEQNVPKPSSQEV